MTYSANRSVALNLEICLGKTNYGRNNSFLKIGMFVYSINEKNYHELIRYYTRLRYEESHGRIPRVEDFPEQFSPIDFYIDDPSRGLFHYKMLFPIQQHDNIKSCFGHQDLQLHPHYILERFQHANSALLYMVHGNLASKQSNHVSHSLHSQYKEGSVAYHFARCLHETNGGRNESFLKINNDAYIIDPQHFNILEHYTKTHLITKSETDLNTIEFLIKDSSGYMHRYSMMFPKHQHHNIKTIFEDQIQKPNLLDVNKFAQVRVVQIDMAHETARSNSQKQGHPVINSLH